MSLCSLKGSDNAVKASGIMIQSESRLKFAMPGIPDHTDRSQIEINSAK